MKKLLVVLFIITFQFSFDQLDTKEIEKSMEKATFWQFKNRNKFEDWDWTYGAFYTGVVAAYKTTKNEKLFEELVAMGKRNQWRPGIRLTHADDHAIMQTYADIYKIKKDRNEDTWPILRASKSMLDDLIVFPYKTDKKHVSVWWWCDALYMGPPSMAKLGLLLDKPEYLTYSDSLYHLTYDLLWDEEESLFARDVDYLWDTTYNKEFKKEKNGKKVFWSRGNGWVFAGLANLLQTLPADYPERPFYESIFKKMAKKLITLQQKDGFWRASLLDPESYPGGETSGTGFYCYGLAWGINNGLLDKKEFYPSVENSWKALFSVVQKNGKVGWVQPIGKDPKKNFGPDSWEVYGTGAYLLAGSEMIKLLK